MDTQNLNITPGNGGTDNKSDKAAKAKTIVGKAAQLAGAAGIGIAGTMVANDMNPKDENLNENAPSANPEEAEEVVEVAESTTGFNPNDIMIEEVDEVEVPSDNHHEDLSMIIEPEPITGMDNVAAQGNVAIVDIDTPDVNDPDEIVECIYGAPDGWEDIDSPDVLLADNGIDDNPDVLDDILNA